VFTRHYPYLFVILAPVILFAPFLIGAQMFYWGTPLLQFYPWRYFALESIRAGFLPLWTPYLGNGAPLVANYQSALFYPPNWLSLVMPLDLSLNWLMVLHILWAGLGMVTLARALGFGALGQCIAGLAFGMGQYVVARASFYSINAAVAWVPWVVWAIDGGLRHKGQGVRRALILSAVLALQLLAGHAQTTWYTWLLAGAWVLWRVLTSQPRRSFTHYFLLSTSFLLALLIASVQVLPTAELLRNSPRADSAEYEFVMTYSFSPWRLLTFLAPDVLGNPARGWFYGYGNYLEDAVYVGVIPLMLAFGAMAGTRFKHSAVNDQPSAVSHQQFASLPRFLVLVLPVTLLLALGRNTPVFPFLYQFVPTFNLFQAPTRMMVWFVFALALLAGWGADRWRAPQGRALYWTRLGAAGAASVIITCAAALFSVKPATEIGQQLLTVAQAVLVAGVNLFIAAAASLLKPKTELLRWELLVAVCLAGDLLYANAGINPAGPADLYRAATPSGSAIRQALGEQRLFQFPDDEQAVKFDPYFSFFTHGDPATLSRGARAALLPNVGVMDGIASANNFDPLVPARYLDFVRVVSETRSIALLNLMNVGVVASRTPLPGWEPVAQADSVTFYRVPGESRRVWLIPAGQAVTVADAAAARAALTDPEFDPARTAILEADDPGQFPNQPYGQASAANDPNAVVLELTAHQEVWVVLADTHYPGWGAFVDGNPVPVRHANYAFRAVLMPAGTHAVEFRYTPQAFAFGAWLSGAGLLIWLGALALALRRW
jgi:hypothetical protein